MIKGVVRWRHNLHLYIANTYCSIKWLMHGKRSFSYTARIFPSNNPNNANWKLTRAPICEGFLTNRISLRIICHAWQQQQRHKIKKTTPTPTPTPLNIKKRPSALYGVLSVVLTFAGTVYPDKTTSWSNILVRPTTVGFSLHGWN